MTSEEAIRLVLEPLSTSLVKISNLLLEKVKSLGYGSSIDESFVGFLKRNEPSDPNMKPVILKCASVAVCNPEPCFNALRVYFVGVNVDAALPVTNDKLAVSHFLNKLDVKLNKDGASVAVRGTLLHVIEGVFLEVLDKMLEMKKDEYDCLTFLFPKLLDPLLLDIQNPNLALLRLANVDKWARLLNKMSRCLPSETIEYTRRAIFMAFKSPSHELFVYRMFRYLDMSGVLNSQVNEFACLDGFATLLEQLKYLPQLTETQEAAVLFLCNMAAGCLAKDEAPPSQFLDSIVKAAAISERSPTYLPVIAVMCQWKPDMALGVNREGVIGLAKKFAMQSMKSAALVLFSLTQLVSDKYRLCLSPFDLEIGKPIDDKPLFEIISAGCYIHCQEDLTMLLVRIALNDFPAFVDRLFPQIKSMDFMEKNASSVFDTMRCLLSNRALEENYRDKFGSFKHDCSVIVSAFLQKNLPKEDSTIIGLAGLTCENPEKLLENSLPQIPSVPEKKKIQATVIRWKKVMLSTESPFEAITSEKKRGELMKAKDFEKCMSPVSHAMALVPLLDYDGTTFQIVLKYLFDRSPHLAFLAARVIRCVAFYAGVEMDDVLTQIAGLKIAPPPEQLYNIIHIINLLVMAAQKEPKIETVEALLPVVILGLCAEFYEIRVQAFNLIDHIPQLSKYFVDSEASNFRQVLDKIALIVSCDVDYAAMLEKHALTLREVASSNYEMLYTLYLATAISHIGSNAVIGSMMQSCHPRIVEIFEEMNKQHQDGEKPLSLVNLASVLACTVTDSSPDSNTVEGSLSIVTTVKDPVILYALAAAVDVSKTGALLQILGNIITDPGDVYFGVFCFAAMFSWRRMEANSNSEESLHMAALFDTVLPQLDRIIDICHAKNVLNNESCDASSVCLTKDKGLNGAIRNLVWTIEHMFSFYMKQHAEPVDGPCMRNNSFAMLPDEIIPQREKWFVFLYNISAYADDPALVTIAKRAFAGFCAVSQIPDSTYGLLSQATDSFTKLAQENPEAFTYLLAHAYQVELNSSIKMAMKYPHFFVCIAKQFLKVKSIREAASLLELRATAPMSATDKNFIQDTMGVVGTLVCLGLFYLSGHVHGYEKKAMRLIKNIALTCALLRNNAGFKKLLAFLSRVCNGDISYREVQKLSGFLAEAFEFAAEQVLFTAFEIIEANECTVPSFVGLLNPWVSLVRLKTKVGIIPNGYSLYVSFSSFTFMQQFVKLLCKPPLLPQVIGLLDTLVASDPGSHRALLFVFALHAFPDMREQCKAVLHFICEGHEDSLENLCLILQFKYWYYDMIQLGKVDQNFDVIKFLRLLEHVTDDQTSGEANVDEYANTTDFALEAAMEMLDDYVLPHVLAFCSVHPLTNNGTTEQNKFAERRRKAIVQLLGSENITISAVAKVLTRNQMFEFFSDCVAWASACGDLDIATRAAELVLQMPCLLRQDRCAEMCRTLEIVVKTVQEKNEPNANRDARNWVTMISSDSETNMNQIYQYISQVIEMVSIANMEGHVLLPSVFWLIAEFIVATDSCFGNLFSNVANAIYQHVKLDVDTSACPVNYEGFLAKFVAHDSVLDLKTGGSAISNLFAAIAMLAEKGAYVTCIGHTDTEAQAVAAVGLLLVPYFATQCDESLFNSFAAKAAQVLDIRPIWADFREHQTPICQTDFFKQIQPLLVPSIVAQILRAYALYIKSSSACAPSIYAICSGLLMLDTSPVGADSFARIVNFALKDRVSANTESACALISAYQKHASFNMKSSATMRISKFPVTTLPNLFTPETWKPSDDVHACVCSFPPMVMIDQNLRILPYVIAVKKSCAQVRVSPFTNWAKLFFDAQLLQGDEGQVDEYKVKPLTSEDIELFRNTIPSPELESKRLNRQDSAQKALRRTDTAEMFRITTSIFAPDQDLIDAAGTDMGFDDFPTVFPK